MNPDDLKPHDISVTERQVPVGGGRFEARRVLTFYVGTHGPFSKEYPLEQASARQFKLDIQKEIDDLSELHQWAG